MSSAPPADIRGLAFGDSAGEIAGTAVAWDGGSCSSLGHDVRIEGSDLDEVWRLEGDGLDLTFAPLGPTAVLELDDAGVSLSYQLVHVTGHMVRDGDELAVDCGGQRSHRLGTPDGKRFSELRVISAWFGTDAGLIVLAARPRKARGHESDHMAGVLFEGEAAMPIADPRLSSTYTAAGVPRRVGLELWIGEEGDEEAEQYARRAAAVAAGPWLACDPSGSSELLHWRMRGQAGVGVYELIEAR